MKNFLKYFFLKIINQLKIGQLIEWCFKKAQKSIHRGIKKRHLISKLLIVLLAILIFCQFLNNVKSYYFPWKNKETLYLEFRSLLNDNYNIIIVLIPIILFFIALFIPETKVRETLVYFIKNEKYKIIMALTIINTIIIIYSKLFLLHTNRIEIINHQSVDSMKTSEINFIIKAPIWPIPTYIKFYALNSLTLKTKIIDSQILTEYYNMNEEFCISFNFVNLEIDSSNSIKYFITAATDKLDSIAISDITELIFPTIEWQISSNLSKSIKNIISKSGEIILIEKHDREKILKFQGNDRIQYRFINYYDDIYIEWLFRVNNINYTEEFNIVSLWRGPSNFVVPSNTGRIISAIYNKGDL